MKANSFQMARSATLAWLMIAAFEVRGDNLRYTTNNGAITVAGYTGSPTEVTIPATVNGLPVVSVGSSAFWNCSSLLSVTIPDGVKSVGGLAFKGCSSLTNAVFGTGITYISDELFANCLNLAGFVIPAGVTNVGTNAFVNCGRLASIALPDSVRIIRSNAFNYCTRLGSVVIPDSVELIEVRAFANCSGLTNLLVGGGLTNIGPLAFSSCSRLAAVAIPPNVIIIGGLAFHTCPSMKAIIVDPDNPVYCSVDGILFDKPQNVLIACPSGKTGIFVVPSTVSQLGDHAFFLSYLSGLYFQGPPPAQGSSVFTSTSITIYYLPGMPGWGSTFGGRPTAIWRPQVQKVGDLYALSTNHFGFTVAWATGMTFVVEASTNAATPSWTAIGTSTLTSSSMFFEDPDWTNYQSRVYRLRWP